MSSEVLADQAVSLLRRLLTDNLNDEATSAARRLAELVDDGLSEIAQYDRLREFEADPTDDETVDHLTDALRIRLEHDGFFRTAVGREIDKALRAVKAGGPAGIAAPRDANGNLIRDASDTPDAGTSFFTAEIKATLGWVLKAAVAIALVYGGVQAYSGARDAIAAGWMDEDTPCSEFLAADRSTQLEAVRQLVVEAGYLNYSYPPFLGAGAVVACGMSTNKTLGQAIGYPG